MDRPSTFFAPMIHVKIVASAIESYKKHLMHSFCDSGITMMAACMWRECQIDGAVFHLHEEVTRNSEFSRDKSNGTTIAIGLFVNDPHAAMAKAVGAGGRALDPVRDSDHEHRQGCMEGPFGHHWLPEKKTG